MTEPIGTGTILDFWFFPSDDPRYGDERAIWFDEPVAAFDDEIRKRFADMYELARTGAYDHWFDDGVMDCLALVILLDQFPRNMFRQSPRAYESDAAALALARKAVARGDGRDLAPVLRWFLYTPFEHAENLATQRECVALARSMEDHAGGADYIRAAERHCEIIERFGRFPHRNAALGRETTPEEADFLKQPDSSF